MKNNGTVQLETERLLLRKFVIEDVEQSHINWASDCETSKYFAFYPHKEMNDTESIIMQWINAYQNEGSNYIWAVVEKNSNEVIGNISADSSYRILNICEIAYMLGSKWWNKGYATEALNAVIHYLFITEDFYMIEAKYNAENIASGKLLQKIGMKQDGVLRDRRLDKETGKRNDLVICSIIKSEYKNNIQTGSLS